MFLVAIGLVGGLLAINYVAGPEYVVEVEVTINNERDGSNATEYAGMVDSELASNPELNKATKDDGCIVVATGKDNIITFTVTCPTNEDESKHLATVAADNFIGWAEDIYGAENFKATREITKMAKEIKASFGEIIIACGFGVIIMLAISVIVTLIIVRRALQQRQASRRR